MPSNPIGRTHGFSIAKKTIRATERFSSMFDTFWNMLIATAQVNQDTKSPYCALVR